MIFKAKLLKRAFDLLPFPVRVTEANGVLHVETRGYKNEEDQARSFFLSSFAKYDEDMIFSFDISGVEVWPISETRNTTRWARNLGYRNADHLLEELRKEPIVYGADGEEAIIYASSDDPGFLSRIKIWSDPENWGQDG